MFNPKGTNFSKGQILLTQVSLKLDQAFFDLDEIGSNFLLTWMKLDQAFFDLDEIGSSFL
jgi:hypothetical protein